MRRQLISLSLFLALAVSVMAQGIRTNTPIHQNNKFDPTQPMQSWECSQNMQTLGTPMLAFLTPTGTVGGSVDCAGAIHAAAETVLAWTATVAPGCSITAGDIVSWVAASGGACPFSGGSEQISGLARNTAAQGETVTIDAIGISHCTASEHLARGHYAIPDVSGHLCADGGSFRRLDYNPFQRLVGKVAAITETGDQAPIILYGPSQYGNGGPLWNAITTQLGDANIATNGFFTVFDTPDASGSWNWINQTPATSTVEQFSIPVSVQGEAWDGAASNHNGWSYQATSDFPSLSSKFVIQRSAGGFVGQVSYVQLPAIGMVQTGVAVLPNPANYAGLQFTVSDSTAIVAEGQPCVGGSNVQAIAFSDGTQWKCF